MKSLRRIKASIKVSLGHFELKVWGGTGSGPTPRLMPFVRREQRMSESGGLVNSLPPVLQAIY